MGRPRGLGQCGAGPGQAGVVGVGLGDRLLFYTGGVSEARSRSGEFFPLLQCKAVREASQPDEILDGLSRDVLRHVGHALDDDAAMLLIRRELA